MDKEIDAQRWEVTFQSHTDVSSQEEFKHRSVSPHSLISQLSSYTMGIKLIFTGGHISLVVAFKGLNVTLGLYKSNYP